MGLVAARLLLGHAVSGAYAGCYERSTVSGKGIQLEPIGVWVRPPVHTHLYFDYRNDAREVGNWSASPYRHLQGVDHELFPHVRGHRSTDGLANGCPVRRPGRGSLPELVCT
jgi:hypothetical protein